MKRRSPPQPQPFLFCLATAQAARKIDKKKTVFFFKSGAVAFGMFSSRIAESTRKSHSESF